MKRGYTCGEQTRIATIQKRRLATKITITIIAKITITCEFCSRFLIRLKCIANALLCAFREMPNLLTNRSMTTLSKNSARMHSRTIPRISARASLVSRTYRSLEGCRKKVDSSGTTKVPNCRTTAFLPGLRDGQGCIGCSCDRRILALILASIIYIIFYRSSALQFWINYNLWLHLQCKKTRINRIQK